ncbi:MAG: hypothetical protein ACTS3F_04285 [Phycisphaerales bacterium]
MMRLTRSMAIGTLMTAVGTASGGVLVLPEGGLPLNVIIDDTGSGQFQVGDKIVDIKSFVPTSIEEDQITVAPVLLGTESKPIYGFDLLGEWTDLPGDEDASGFNFQFNVTAMDPEKRIVGLGLSFNGFATGENAFASVSETVFEPDSGDLIDNLAVSAAADTPEDGWVLQDQFGVEEPMFDNGFQDLNIVKDFQIFAGPNDTVGTSLIRQTFVQIPTPGAWGLLAGGGLIAMRRRR